jgi:hypothetical protein
VTWAPDYITVAEARAYLRVPDAVDDVEIALWITAASRAIDTRCNRQFGQLAAPATRVYQTPPFYDPSTGLWTLEIDDVQDVTGMSVNGTAYASQAAILQPVNAPADGKPWTRLAFNVLPYFPYPGYPVTTTVVARWGWTTVPSQVQAATRLQVSRWHARRDSPFGIAGSPDQGSELRLLAKLDSDVITSLSGLSRRRRLG